jgi:hypothetical protein
MNQTPVARLNRWLGIIAECEAEISGHASSRPERNPRRRSHWEWEIND